MSDWSPQNIPILNLVDAVRKRPGMYVGSTDFFGLIHYLVCPVALLLMQRPTRISVSATDTGFVIESDAAVPLRLDGDGRYVPFEQVDNTSPGYGLEGGVLNALSSSLVARVSSSGSCVTLHFQQGKRTAARTDPSQDTFTRLEFAPDPSIFSVTSVAPTVFESYLRRMSYLHPVRFRLIVSGATHEYAAPGGLRDLFDAVTAPYQILHEPIHVTAEEGRRRVELIFAYQSWKGDLLWCFVNNGRAVEGGTHEVGLRKAVRTLAGVLNVPGTKEWGKNGVVAVMSLTEPAVTWEGCIKARIGNPELVDAIPRLIVPAVTQWVADRPDLGRQLTRIQTFTFPDAWN